MLSRVVQVGGRRSVFQTSVTEPGHKQRPILVVDCGLDHHMTHERELKSLAKQIELTYIANLRAPRPFQLCLTGLERGSRTHHTLTTHITGFHNYQVEVTDRPYNSLFASQQLIYLSPDSEHDLDTVEESKVYVVGGIVDLTINKNLTLHRARVAGLQTARLPITQYMEFPTHSSHNLNLPINIVACMLLDRFSGAEWPQILQTHMPKRKGFVMTSTS